MASRQRQVPPSRQVPSPQGNHNQPQAAAAIPSPRRRRARGVECMTARELRKFNMFQKAANVYKDVRQSSSLFLSMADAVEETSQALCQKVISTRTGKTADKILARVTRKAHQSVEVEGKVQDLAVSMLRMAFRYWPPTLLTRWGVDVSLGVSSATLALMKDIYAIQTQPEEEIPYVDIDVVYSQYVPNGDNGDGSPTKSSPKKDAASTSKQTCQVQEGEGEVEESVMEAIAAPDYSLDLTDYEDESGYLNCEPTYCEWILDGLATVTNITVRLFFWVFMPLITVVTLMLCRVSSQLHSWAGMSELETPEERKEREELFALLTETPDQSNQKYSDMNGNASDGNGHDGDDQVEKNPSQNSPDEMEVPRGPEITWLFDTVVDRQVSTLTKYLIIGKMIDAIGIQRPMKIAEKTAEKLKELKSKKESLVKYLEEDPEYDEENDPDFQPNEDHLSEDSLEYREDEDLEPENKTDKDVIVEDVSVWNNKETAAASNIPITENTGTKGSWQNEQLMAQLLDDIFPIEVKKPISPLLSPAVLKEKGTSENKKYSVRKIKGAKKGKNVINDTLGEMKQYNLGTEDTVENVPKEEMRSKEVALKDNITETVKNPGCNIRGILVNELDISANDSHENALDPEGFTRYLKEPDARNPKNKSPALELCGMKADEMLNNVDSSSVMDGPGNCDKHTLDKIRLEEIKKDSSSSRKKQVIETNQGTNNTPEIIISGSLERDVTRETPEECKLSEACGFSEKYSISHVNTVSEVEAQNVLDLNDPRRSSNVDTGHTANG